MQEYSFTPLNRMITVRSVVTASDAERQKNFYFSGEMHNFWELVYVVSGNIMATADERVFSLSAGQLLCHKPMEFHRIWSADDSIARLCIISFEAEGYGMRLLENKLLTLNPIEGERFRNITAALRKVIRGQNHKDFYDQDKFAFLGSKAAVELEALLFDLIGRDPKPRPEKDRTGEQYEYIVSVLNANCDKALTVEEIARLCHFSVSNLKRIFHMYSDIGVMKYFTSIKLRRAMQMLRDGEPIVKISDELGFSSPNYFHAVFKKETGMTPKEYISKNRHIGQQK